MAYTLVTQPFGTSNANSQVIITEVSTGVPAIILATATGGVLSTNGTTSTDASGNISVYVDTARTWSYKLVDEQHSDNSVMAGYRKVSSNAELATISGQFGTTYVVENAPSGPAVSYVWNGTTMVPTSLLTTAQAAATQALVSRDGNLYQVSNRCGVPKITNTGLHQMMTRRVHRALAPIRNLALVYASWYMASGTTETALGGAGQITASIEYPVGVFTRVTFGGAVTGTHPDNVNLVSDLVTVSIPEGATFWVRTWVSNATGLVYDSTHIALTGDGFVVSATTTPDLTAGGAVTQATINMYGPSAIVGSSGRRAVAIAGDSIVYGTGDTAYNGDLGYIARALGPRVPYLMIATPSDYAGAFASSNTRRLELATYCTDVVMQYGTNDIPGTPAATVKTRLEAAIALFGSKPVYACTLPPRTTSTDVWVTTGNQTVTANEAVRITVNGYIRAGLIGSAGTFDVDAVLGSSWNSGLWSLDTGSASVARTGDGTHPAANGHALVARSGAIPASLFY